VPGVPDIDGGVFSLPRRGFVFDLAVAYLGGETLRVLGGLFCGLRVGEGTLNFLSLRFGFRRLTLRFRFFARWMPGCDIGDTLLKSGSRCGWTPGALPVAAAMAASVSLASGT